MSDHALAVRVMRLQPPALNFQEAVNVSYDRDLLDRDLLDDPSSRPTSDQLGYKGGVFAHRLEPQGSPVGSIMVLPQAFGNVYLGQMFTVLVTVSNTATAPCKHIGIKVELTTERSRLILYDTTHSPLPTLAPGKRHEFLVKHEIKELGFHNLVCTTTYLAEPEGAVRSQPQAFRFSAANPLTVRTKHRNVGDCILLEATLENKTKRAMFLDTVRLQPSPPYTAEQIMTPNTSVHGAANNITSEQGPLTEYIASVPLLPPDVGAASFLFKLKRGGLLSQPPPLTAVPSSPPKTPLITIATPTPSPPSSSTPSTEPDGQALGKIEIRWCGRCGEPARLQTQTVSLGPLKELRISLGTLPYPVTLLQPFTAEVVITSGSDRMLGPLKVSATPAAVHGPPRGIVMEGPQSVVVEAVQPKSRVSVHLSLVAVVSGAQQLQGILLTDERDGKVYDALAPFAVFVES